MTYRIWSMVTVRTPDGSLRIQGPFHYSARTPQEGYQQIESLRKRLSTDEAVERSTFGLEIRDKDVWKEWYDDGGLDVIERFEGVSPLPAESTLVTV